jgi:PQQ-dependent catabolism-associated CXXCW motif protein
MLDTAATATTDNPYPGLRSFERDETHIFFGREETVSDMVDRMATHRFLAVTGYSGSGKSSLVRVGLLDALDRGMLVDAGSNWAIADFKPGGQPFARLTAALVKAAERDVPEHEDRLIEAKLARGPKGLLGWLDEIDFPEDTNLLLLVDQFEEIFRYRQGRVGDDVSAFVQLLLASAQQRERPIYVVITMRSDFLGDCARFTGLAEQINDGQFLTPRLTRDQCREAIEGPAGVYDGRVEAELTTRMLNDMAGNPDQLPLMQHLLMLLWDEAQGRKTGGPPTLTLADYERLGGIGPSDWGPGGQNGGTGEDTAAGARKGALSDHADRVLATLSGGQRRIAERLFRALTESQGTDHRAVRRPVQLEQAAAIADVSAAELAPIVEAFRAPGVHFLTPARPAELKPETIVDITHESLIRQWGQLREWVAEEHQSAETYRSIERGAKQWLGRRGNLLSKLDLAVARKWRRSERPNAAWAHRYGDAFAPAMTYLQKSVRRRRWRGFLRGTALTAVPVVILLGAAVVMGYLKATLPYVNPADEWSNFDVEPTLELASNPGSDTPRAIPGGRVVGTAELERAIAKNSLKGADFILVDVLTRASNQEIQYIPGSIYIGNVGNSGSYTDETQRRLEAELAKLTKGDLNKQIIFFCSGARCWTSYNASLRAIRLGYKYVYWYRGGINSWQAARKPYPVGLGEFPIKWRDAIAAAPTNLQSLIQDFWPSPQYDFRRGVSYSEQKMYDDAIDAFTRVIQKDPFNADAYSQRGRVYERKAEYLLAIADHIKASEIQPNNALHSFDLGIARLRNGDLEAGFADYVKAMSMDAKLADARRVQHAVVYEIRGESHYRKREYDAAIQLYARALEINPQAINPLRRRGDAWYQKGVYDKAVADFGALIGINPKDAGGYSARADAYRAKGDQANALADYSKAIELEPQQGNHLANRAYIAFNNGDFNAALFDFVRAGPLTNDPYVMLFRYIARARTKPGGTSALELAADGKMYAANKQKADIWPIPVFELLTGKRTTAESLLVAAGGPDEGCEAHFYIGQWHLIRGERDEAVTALKQAAGACKKTFHEYRAAVADLKRLEPL